MPGKPPSFLLLQVAWPGEARGSLPGPEDFPRSLGDQASTLTPPVQPKGRQRHLGKWKTHPFSGGGGREKQLRRQRRQRAGRVTENEPGGEHQEQIRDPG